MTVTEFTYLILIGRGFDNFFLRFLLSFGFHWDSEDMSNIQDCDWPHFKILPGPGGKRLPSSLLIRYQIALKIFAQFKPSNIPCMLLCVDKTFQTPGVALSAWEQSQYPRVSRSHVLQDHTRTRPSHTRPNDEGQELTNHELGSQNYPWWLPRTSWWSTTGWRIMMNNIINEWSKRFDFLLLSADSVTKR